MSDTKEVADILKAADAYLKRLQALNQEVQNAQEQIRTTSKETEANIEATFSQLTANITKILNSRRDTLIKIVRDTERQSLSPLIECHKDIEKKIGRTSSLIVRGQCFLNGSNGMANVAEFSNESSLLGSLPAIPELKEVPYLTFQSEPSTEAELLGSCSQFGEVFRIAPVQISHTKEKPGAILVEWQGVDNEERLPDIQEFRLQRAFGNVVKDKHLVANFSDCYSGLDTQFLVKDLHENQPYSFRVCCKLEGSNDWSPWSVPQVAATSIKPFSWRSNGDYLLADDNKIATPLKESPSVLVSDGPQFRVGYSVEFTYLEFDHKDSTLGLVATDSPVDGPSSVKAPEHQYFALDSNGEIYVDGAKKSTKLPEAVKGLKVCFTCELVNNGERVRVNVDSCDKRVTYDWPVPKEARLYFAARLNSPHSKVMVE